LKNLLYFIAFICSFNAISQTKVSGHIFDENNDPVAFANVIFKGSSISTITNENGRFYLESDET
jgi:putative heme iron utilization protein